MNNRITRGYLLAIEMKEGDSPPEAERMKDMFETLLYDHGYDAVLNIESMGEIDVYPEKDE